MIITTTGNIIFSYNNVANMFNHNLNVWWDWRDADLVQYILIEVLEDI